jgi:restriction system protein
MWPFKKDKTIFGSANTVQTTLFCTPEIVETCLVIFEGKGARFSLFYANMCGYEREIIDYDKLADFKKIIEGEPNFTEAGVEFAVNKLIRGIDLICSSDSFGHLVFGIDGKDNSEYREILGIFQKDLKKIGLAALCERIGFDVRQFIISNALSRREFDLAAVFAKLEEKKDHLIPLLLRTRARAKNKYGEMDYTDYWKEIVEFVNYYFPEGTLKFFYHLRPYSTVTDYLENWFGETQDESLIPTDGIDFEYWCAAQLEKSGWSVRVTKASGDQGVDLVASQAGKTVVIQCKRYSNPAGNKSVQEAYTGMAHYGSDAACVIATRGFTRAAVELSNYTAVLLLDAENIGEFNSMIDTKIAY